MVELLGAAPRGGDEADLERKVREYVAESTGRQTIYQMIWLADEVAARGGPLREPEEYKTEYLRRLHQRISGRLTALESGESSPGDFLVPGARELLDELRRRGAKLYCASGTDEADVRREAELLGVADAFDGRIWGAQSDYRNFSKKMVVERLIAENGLAGPELLTVGDGYVEIEEGARAGGLTVGAATDEAGRSGEADAWKRERLIAAGADLIAPDFAEANRLLAYLFRD
jgi:phosphoglycolate phosphatase-like HAD superfamily hydrolase